MNKLFTPETFATNVTTLADAIKGAAIAHTKFTTLVKQIAEPAYGDADKQAEIAEFITSLKLQVVAQRADYKKYLCSRGRAAEVSDFEKAHKDAFTYVTRVAGKAAGCKFAYVKKTDSYIVEEAKAENEPNKQTASGKDENSASQSADIVAATIADDMQTEAMRKASAAGFFAQYLSNGGTIAELTDALAAFASKAAAEAAMEEQNEAANEPKAPAILQSKMADVMREKGAQVKPPRKRKAG